MDLPDWPPGPHFRSRVDPGIILGLVERKWHVAIQRMRGPVPHLQHEWGTKMDQSVTGIEDQLKEA